jgi:hypothetical protein
MCLPPTPHPLPCVIWSLCGSPSTPPPPILVPPRFTVCTRLVCCTGLPCVWLGFVAVPPPPPTRSNRASLPPPSPPPTCRDRRQDELMNCTCGHFSECPGGGIVNAKFEPNGVCVEGWCECSSEFQGADCAVERQAPLDGCEPLGRRDGRGQCACPFCAPLACRTRVFRPRVMPQVFEIGVVCMCVPGYTACWLGGPAACGCVDGCTLSPAAKAMRCHGGVARCPPLLPAGCLGAIGPDSMCCGNSTVTDRDGNCCWGSLDACGVCNGTGIITDVYGRCCSLPLTSSGLCCPEGLDDCGVCGGSNSCTYVGIVTGFTNASVFIVDPSTFESARCVGLGVRSHAGARAMAA